MGRDNNQHDIKKSFYWYNLYSDVAAYVATCAACSKNTQHDIKKSFYLYNLYSDVAAYVATCAACSKNKKINRRKRADTIQYHARSPMEHVLLGPFNMSSKGDRSLV